MRPNQLHLSLASQKLIVIIVCLLAPLAGATIDIYAPSLPAITTEFHVAPTLTRLTITIFLLGLGLFQTLFGSLSDSYGRRVIIIPGLTSYIITLLLAPQSQNICFLLFIRFLQGFFVGASSVIIKSILSETFTGKTLAKYATYTTISWAMGPIIAPAVGGYLQAYLGWHASFYALSGYAFIGLILVIFCLPETNHHMHPLNIKTILNNYKLIFTHKVFIGASLILGLVYSLIAVFNVAGPFLIQVQLKFSSITFGHVALILGAAWFLGNGITRLLIHRLSSHSAFFLTLSICLIASLTMVLFALTLPMQIWTITLPTVILFIFGAITFAFGFTICVSAFPHMAGAASAALGSVFITVSALMSGIGSFLKAHNQLPLSLSYVIIILLCWLIYKTCLRQIAD